MKYNRILNTPQIHKVINVQIIEIAVMVILAILFILFGAPMIYPDATFGDFGEMPLVRLVRWLIVLKVSWGLFNIRFLNKNTLHWYRFI